MLPTNRETLKLFCLRKLGHPVITIDVDDDQLEDRIDEALIQFQTFHYDGTQKAYTSIKVTPSMVANNTNGVSNGIQMPSDTFGVTRIFTLQGSSTTNTSDGGFNMFDINYQIRLNELYDYTAGDYTYFELANQHLRMLEMLFTGEIPIRYNRYENILYVDCDWAVRFTPGMFFVCEVYRLLNNTSEFWQDPFLVAYTTALIKEQWGSNLKKFRGVTLPGNMLLNGKEIYEEALLEKAQLIDDLHHKYQMPAEWLVG